MTIYLRRRAEVQCGFPANAGVGLAGGANITIEASVLGEIDPNTGMVVNIREIDSAIKNAVVAPLHGRYVEHIPGARDLYPTLENLSKFAFAAIQRLLGAEHHLAFVELLTNKVRLRFHPEEAKPAMMLVTRTYDFSASHRLHSVALSQAENIETFGKCNWQNGHGHNYILDVTVTGDLDPIGQQIVDLTRLDSLVEELVLLPMDHKHLNYDVPDFVHLNPTSENLTIVIWQRLLEPIAELLNGNGRLYRVVVCETARNYFEYYGD